MSPANATLEHPPESYHDKLTRLSEAIAAGPGPHLIGIDDCRVVIYPDEKSAPAERTWKKWHAARYFRSYKIGRRVFGDPEEIRADLSRRFKINAVEVR
jgi:hypothetical protein